MSKVRYAAALFAAALAADAFLGGAAAQPQFLLLADEVVYDSQTGVITARGNVEISGDGRVLRADSVSYDQNADTIHAVGNVSLTEADGDVAFAEEAELTDGMREGTLQGFSMLMGESGRLAAVSGVRSQGRYTEARGAVFTPCKICSENDDDTPVWQIRATRVIHDEVDRELTFENAILEFLGVPVFFLPVFSHADPTVSYKSGILLPVIGSSTFLGTFAQIPYYISLGPSRDATIEPFFTTDAGTVVRAEYRERRDRSGFWLQGSLGYDPSIRILPSENAWTSHLFGSGRIPLNNLWRAGFDLQLTSNDTYLRRYEFSDSDRLTTDVFADAVWGRSRASIYGFYFQSLRPGEPQGSVPLALPLAEFTYIPDHKIYGGRLKTDVSALALMRSEGTDMLRTSFSTDWSRLFITDNGQLYTFATQGRGDLYHVTDVQVSVPAAPRDSDTIGRMLGYAALEWRWPHVGTVGMGNTTLVVEPIVQLVAATLGGNPVGLPNEDSTGSEFDELNLFSPNELPGLDLWTGGSRSNIGVRATAFLPGGSIEAMLGQDFRAAPDPNFAPGSGLGGERSDIVGRFKLQFPPMIDLVHRFRIAPKGGSLRRNEVYLTAAYGGNTINLSYLKLAQNTADPALGPREEIAINANVAFYGNWSAFAEVRRDLEVSKTLDSGAGLRYEDECFLAIFGFRRRDTSDRELTPSSSIFLRLGLKTGLTSG